MLLEFPPTHSSANYFKTKILIEITSIKIISLKYKNIPKLLKHYFAILKAFTNT